MGTRVEGEVVVGVVVSAARLRAGYCGGRVGDTGRATGP